MPAMFFRERFLNISSLVSLRQVINQSVSSLNAISLESTLIFSVLPYCIYITEDNHKSQNTMNEFPPPQYYSYFGHRKTVWELEVRQLNQQLI